MAINTTLSPPRTRPTVSVGMPVFNGSRFIGQAIESILAQSCSDLELIISDNASTDGTPDICRGYCRRDPRVRYIRQPVNIGAPANFNFVFRESTGRYFKWASANDLSAPDLIQACKEVLDDSPDVVLCVGKTKYIDEDGAVSGDYQEDLAIQADRPADRFLHSLAIFCNNAHAGLFRAESVARTRLERRYPSGDMVFLAELALLGKFVQLPKALFFRRVTATASTLGKNLDYILELHYPGEKRIFSCYHWCKWCSYFDVVRRAQLPWSEKQRLFGKLCRMVIWDRHQLWRELIPCRFRRD